MPKTDPENDKNLRTYLSIPTELSLALAQRFKLENPRDERNKKIPYGRWLAEKALAGIEANESASGQKPVASGAGIDTKNIETSAAEGARTGVITSLKGFAKELGDEFGDRIDVFEYGVGEKLMSIDERISRIEMRLAGKPAGEKS